MKRWVGIDPGEKRLGVARSDALGMVAHPQAILGSYEELRDWLRAELGEHEIGGAIVGLPRNMDGSYGPLARRSKALIDRLRQDLPDLAFFLWDERLTSRQAGRMAAESRSSGRGRARIDDKAAAILLQSYLEAGCPQPSDPGELGET